MPTCWIRFLLPMRMLAFAGWGPLARLMKSNVKNIIRIKVARVSTSILITMYMRTECGQWDAAGDETGFEGRRDFHQLTVTQPPNVVMKMMISGFALDVSNKVIYKKRRGACTRIRCSKSVPILLSAVVTRCCANTSGSRLS